MKRQKEDQALHHSSKKLSKYIQNSKYTLLTYNIFMRPAGINTYQDDYKNQRLEDIIKQICQFDIVCFQQLFGLSSFRVQRILDSAINMGFNYWKTGDKPAFWKGPTVDSGLMVISKYPIISSYFKSFDLGVLSDGSADKGVIYCKIDVQGFILHLFNFHLQASYVGHKNEDYCIVTRLAQIKMLRSFIKQKLIDEKWKKEDLILMACDLNVDANKPDIIITNHKLYEQFGLATKFNEYEYFIQFFEQENMNICDLALRKYKKHPVTFGGSDKILTSATQYNTFQRLDYIFQVKINNQTKSNLKPIQQSIMVNQFQTNDLLKNYTQLSDHFGLSITLTNAFNQ